MYISKLEMYIFRLEMYIFKLKMKNFGGFASFSGGEKKLSGRLVRVGPMRSPSLAVYELLSPSPGRVAGRSRESRGMATAGAKLPRRRKACLASIAVGVGKACPSQCKKSGGLIKNLRLINPDLILLLIEGV